MWIEHQGTSTWPSGFIQGLPDGYALIPGLHHREATRARQTGLDRQIVSSWPIRLNFFKHGWLWLTFCLSQPFRKVLKFYLPMLHIFPSPAKLCSFIYDECRRRKICQISLLVYFTTDLSQSLSDVSGQEKKITSSFHTMIRDLLQGSAMSSWFFSPLDSLLDEPAPYHVFYS